MASTIQTYNYDGTKSFRVAKWKIRVGSQLFYNSTILCYKEETGDKSEQKDPFLKYKSNIAGIVTELLVSEGDLVSSGDALLKVQPCTHPVIMKDMCAECGTDLRHLDRDNFEKLTAATTFSMVHVVPELKVSLEQAEKLGRDDEDRLIKNKKLVLLVDLDQTIIHTTNDNIPQDMPDVCHFQLYGPYSPWYHTKFRPGTEKFLENISKYYELHICTFGARLYAHKIAKMLDPDGKFFSHRILSRDECFDPSSKTANLKALFPRGDDMVCIIDDREDVWNFAPNVIQVKPYTFFQNTGDINAPPPAATINETKSTKETSGSLNKENKLNIATEDSKKISAEKESIPKSDATSSKEYINTDTKTAVTIQNNVNKTENKNTSDATECNSSTPDKKSEITTSKQTASNSSVDASKSANVTDAKADTENIDSNVIHADDYLLYLEEILITVHNAYYNLYEKMKEDGLKAIPDLKKVVPDVRKNILKNVNVVFSSVIPTNCEPECHHFWTLAESLGASVSRDLVLGNSKQRTTHVVGSKLGTAKVNAAKRHRKIWIVSLDWLLCCAERWEHADERLFPLSKNLMLDNENSKNILQKQHKYKRSLNMEKKKNEQEKFYERVFAEAGLALSQDDIDDMDKEIEEACSEESEGENQACSASGSSSSRESLSSGDYPKGWRKRRKCDTSQEEKILEDRAEESSDAETIGSVDEEMAEAVKLEFENRYTN